MLSMSKGPTAYFEAEKSLIVWLESLTVYHKVIWQEIAVDYRLQQRAIERFITLHRHNRNLLESQARSLLDFIAYFPAPVAEEIPQHPFEKVLDDDDLT
jgi:hypothetical protein